MTFDSLTDLRAAIASRRISAEEAARAALDAAAALNPALNAFIDLFPDQALAQARESDRRLAAGEAPRPLEGVPVALKDNICLDYGRTTAASRILENYRSPFTATAAQRLLDAGAVIIGKTNLDEFAMGSSTEHSAFGPTRNPWDLARVPGGSSGGSAAAVAAGIVPAALGSDTGGSIREPAGLCGIVGVKPTYGRVSRYGLVAFASSLDQIGPMTRTVADAAAVLSVICGHDPKDSTSADLPPADFGAGLEQPVTGLRLGVPRQALDRCGAANHPGVTAALDAAISVYQSLGAEIVEVDLPHTVHAVAAYYIIAPAEASSNLARFDGIRYGRRAALRPGETLEDLYARSRAEGLGPEVQRRIMLGTYVLSSGYYDAYYTTALRVRRLIKRDYDLVFADGNSNGNGGRRGGEGCHAILMPSSPSPAFRIGEKSGDPLALYQEDVYTVGVNLAGLPALTIPGGFARADESDPAAPDLPVGLQLVGPALSEALLLRIARMFEAATQHHLRRPPNPPSSPSRP